MKYIHALGVTLLAVFGGSSVAYADNVTVVQAAPCIAVDLRDAERRMIPATCVFFTYKGRRFSTALIDDGVEISTVEYLTDGSQEMHQSFEVAKYAGSI